MKSLIHILCATDSKYVPYCGVMLTSVFRNNSEDQLCIHVLGTNLNMDNKDDLQKNAKQYSQQIEIYDVDNDLTKYIPPTNILDKNTHIALATYNRIFVLELLPQNISKVLYLDCDLIVLGLLRGCWEQDLDGYALGAVIDSGAMNCYSRLHLDPKKNMYFNGGVLLMNLDFWRMYGIQQKCIDYIAQN